MNINAVIAHIRANSTFLALDQNGERCVAGAAELAQIVDKAWLSRPAAYVLPVQDEAEPNVSLNGLDQDVTETVSIVVDFSNRADPRGQLAASLLETARADLFRCLLNWRPEWANSSQGFAYAGGHLVHMDRERMHWQFDFSLKILITDQDGWQVEGDQITEIDATLTDPQTGDPTPVDFKVSQSGAAT